MSATATRLLSATTTYIRHTAAAGPPSTAAWAYSAAGTSSAATTTAKIAAFHSLRWAIIMLELADTAFDFTGTE